MWDPDLLIFGIRPPSALRVEQELAVEDFEERSCAVFPAILALPGHSFHPSAIVSCETFCRPDDSQLRR